MSAVLKLTPKALEAAFQAAKALTVTATQDQTGGIYETLNNLSLKDQNNHTFNATNTLKGHNTFLLFGFKDCEDICPMTADNVAEAYKRANPKPKIVVISIHPEADKKAAAEYAKKYTDRGINPKDISILFAAGGDKKAQMIQEKFGMSYYGDNSDGHSPTIITIGSNGVERGKRVNGMESDADKQLFDNLPAHTPNYNMAPVGKKHGSRKY